MVQLVSQRLTLCPLRGNLFLQFLTGLGLLQTTDQIATRAHIAPFIQNVTVSQ